MTDYSLLQDFIVETVEHLEEMESNLLRLEANPDDRETLDNIFRSVHTIKGASEYLGLEGLAELSHKLENLLDSLRRNECAVDRIIIDLLIAVRDRMGLLVEDLESTQTEQTVFADLIERLQAIKTATLPEDGTAGNPVDSPPETDTADSGETEYEEEFDEELFAIFLEQLKEGLTALQAHTLALATAACNDQIAILATCLTRIDPLRSSANYMGYDQLIDLYDGWAESIRNARDRLAAGDEGFMPDFIRDYMQANLFTVAARFPRIQFECEAAVIAEDAHGSQPELATDRDTNVTTGDLLDAYAVQAQPEAVTLAEAGSPPEVPADATALFDRLSRSFDDCRRQGVAPRRAEGTAEIAAELFSTPDETFVIEEEAPPEAAEPTTAATASADDSWDYLTAPAAADDADETGSTAPETSSTEETLSPGDPPGMDAETAQDDGENYEEEYDEELFGIFLEQLEESLGALKAHAAALSDADGSDREALLSACLAHIDPLRSSANYMGYSQLTALYDDWTAAIQEARSRLADDDDGFLSDFRATHMDANIAAVVERFPQIRVAAPEAEDVAAALSGAFPSGGPAIDPQDDPGANPADDENEDSLPEMTDSQDEKIDSQAAPSHSTDGLADSLENSLLQDFLVETVEHLEEMEGSLLHLEKEPGHQGTLDDIFRSAHTIKGAAEYLGMTRIADLSHQLENLLDQMRRNERPADSDTIDLLMTARDRIGLLTEDLAQSGQEQTVIDDLLERIQRLQGEQPDDSTAAPADAHDPTDGSDIEIPLFADSVEDDDASTALEIPETPASDDPPEMVAITAAIEAAAEDDGTATALPPEPDDRRDPDRAGRRQSDRIGEKILKQSIRVDATKIDALMNQVGELVVSRAWFAQLFSEMRELQQNLKQSFKLDTREMKQVKGLTFRLSEATVALGRVANELQEGVMKVRMLPIAQLFNRYPRLVFDLVRDTDKQVELDIRGEDTELDKMVIEEISDPLIHIIRNAVDHGVEPVDERRRGGKPETATIRLEAYHEGNHVVIEIADDGRGLDLDRIRAKALAGNFVSREEIERMTPKELTGLIMQPGFSTAEKVTHTSGRGVGMDVVKKNIEKLNGTIEIDTTTGTGTRFRIKIPLTLAIIPALLIKVHGELFTIPLATVEETLRIAEDDISTIEGVEVMQLRDSTLPLVRLDGLFNMETTGAIDRAFVVVVSTGMKRVGLVVDELLGQEEVVIKPLEDYLQERSGFSGATILGDGRISLILDVYELVNLSIDREAQKKAKAAVL